MKIITQLLLLTLLSETAHDVYAQKNNARDLRKIEWLLGKWNRTNVKPGQTAVEIWTKTSSVKFEGRGVTLQEKDTIFIEKLQLVQKSDGIYYVADITENKRPTYFKLTTIAITGFVAENAKHDFPKKIVYQFADTQLKATVSGNDKEIDFIFVKDASR